MRLPAAAAALLPASQRCTDTTLFARQPHTPHPCTNDAQYIASSAEVRLRSFTTSIHKVAPVVSYKNAGGGNL